MRKLPPLKVKGKKGTPPLYAVLVDEVTAEDLARLSARVLAGGSLVTTELSASAAGKTPDKATATR
mgnify:FL=1